MTDNTNPPKPEFDDKGSVTKVTIPEELYVYLHEEAGIHTPQSHIGGSDYTKRLLEELDIDQDDYVLDVGCGRGGELAEIAESTRASMYGIDSDEAIYKKAKEQAEELDDVSVTLGKAEDKASYPENTLFDVAICLGVLPFIADKEAVWRNVYESLKEGGTFVFTEFPPSVPVQEVEDLYWPQELTPPPSKEGIKSKLEDIGFQKVKIQDRTEELRNQTQEVKNSYPRDKVQELFSEEYEKTARKLLSDWIDALEERRVEFASFWCIK